ncbi:flagellar brake protein [Bacillus fonticola]|uniref:flagellar brake protein n=1 Tax=Bacillus fonticola TaxID=2728853 RepID=UPI001472B36B|nr:flagellar brake domain-containing protein [Bacillus fonticola]
MKNFCEVIGLIEIGTSLQIEWKQEDGSVKKLRSKVADVSQDAFAMQYPVDNTSGKTVFLSNDTYFKVQFVNAAGQALGFRTHIVGRKKDRVPMIVCFLPEVNKMEKIQRREFVRVEAMIDVAFTSVNPPQKTFHTVTTDISAGGLAAVFKPHLPFQKDEIYETLLVLPFQNGTRYVKVQTKVIRFIEKRERTLVTLEFQETTEKEKQLITRYCFERQLEMRRKSQAI